MHRRVTSLFRSLFFLNVLFPNNIIFEIVSQLIAHAQYRPLFIAAVYLIKWSILIFICDLCPVFTIIMQIMRKINNNL